MTKITGALSNTHQANREPIAIVGMGCRFAGAPDLESFWRVLHEGVETVRDYPGGRFADLDAVFAPDFTGHIASRRGGFLDNLDRLDAEFFGISPREAELLDPQQRLLLEVAWQAMENAGLVRNQIAGTQTGVFVGVWNTDFETCVRTASSEPAFYSTTGGGRYAASGRLAYFFDLRGPNLTLDTGCSSSLVAAHLACQSLWSGESEMALVAAANAILSPDITLAYSSAGMLSPDGRCKFGDSSADGYVRSEGAAAVVLKPLSRALADGDPIHALIRGTAVNSCGRSSGFLVTPSASAQQEVLRAALRNAGVSPDQIDYVEAHGTGTRTGDPVEIGAIGAVLASERRSQPCLIGSVKTNIGHTESAAGLAGLIKVVLALQHRTIPASLHFREANPDVPWQDLPVKLATEPVSWPVNGHAPLAAVHSIGITGTNSMVVLEAAPAVSETTQSGARAQLLTLSAQCPNALRELAQNWRDRLGNDEPGAIPLSDICYTAAVRRTHHDYRLALTACDTGEAARKLTDWLVAGGGESVTTGKRSQPRKLAFLFPGQGGQWLGMGRSLLRDEPVFRSAMEACDTAIQRVAGWSVIERLIQDDGAACLQEIDTIQPVLFAFLVSLAEMWRAWGVEPQAVAGHSMGEVAAAVVAGMLTLEDGAAVICHRSRLMRSTSGKGLMALTALNAQDASAMAAQYPGRISVAAFNSPESTVLAGDTGAIEELLAELTARQVFCRRIKVDVASHSPQMEPLVREMAEAVRGIQPQSGAIPLYSTTTGQIEPGTALDAEHWGRNLRQPVLFASTIERLLADGFNTFIEIGPHPVLLSPVEETIQASGSEAVAVASLRRERDERAELLAALGCLYTVGYPVDFARVFPPGRCVSLPDYPFQRERHWLETSPGRASRKPATQSAADHIYELQWISGGLDSLQKESVPGGFWILLDGDRTLGARLYSELASRGQLCARVERGEAFRIKAPLEYEVNPARPEDLDRVLSACAAEANGSIAGVIHAWGLETAGQESDLSEIWQAQQTGCFSALRVIQALVRWNPAHMPRLWLITADAAGPGAQTGFAQGPLWGLSRVAAQEHPELVCSNADIGGASGEELRSLARLVCADPREDQIALRGSACLIPRYQRSPETAVAAPTLAPDATYLITGGTGGIGPLVARWMIERGARNIALVARRPATAETRAELESMLPAGATVQFIAADIADQAQATAAIANLRKNMPPLRGVCHLAATSAAILLRDSSEEDFRRLLAAKTAGAWNLHVATRDLPLDFFLLFSSLAAVISQPGLGAYAAGNAFLDALAGYRRAQGLPALSLEWGPWANLGLARGEAAERGVRAYERQGIRPLSGEMALDGLGRAMTRSSSSLMIAPISWETFAAAQGNDLSSKPFLELTAPEKKNALAAPEPGLRERLLALATARQRRTALETFLTGQLAQIVKLPASRIDIQKPVGTLGMDSLMSLEFVRRLASASSIRLPATAIFNYPTIQALSLEIARRMGVPMQEKEPEFETVPVTPVPAATASAQWDVSAMTEEDAVQALLARTEAGR